MIALLIGVFLQVKGQARQRVRPAIQLLSNSVATAAERFTDRFEEARYIRIFDSGIDALNGQCPVDPKPLRRGMRASSEGHLKALEDLEGAVRLLFNGKRRLLPFQSGLLATINSLRGLVGDVAAEFGPDAYVLPGRVNQDALESFFGLLRGKGGANFNPSPSEAKCRVKNLTAFFALRIGVDPLSLDPRPAPAALPAAEPLPATDVTDALMAEDWAAVRPETPADLQDAEAIVAEVCPAGPATTQPTDLDTGVTAAEYGLAHAAGYVAAKVRRVDSSLAAPSALTDESAPVEALWTRLRSQGGLSVPTVEWLAQFRAMDAAFCRWHGHEDDGLSRSPHVIEDLVRQLAGQPGALDIRVVRRFVRLRTFIRLSCVNRLRRNETVAARELRKRKQFAS